ncbi:MAG: hypothetical protein Q9200_000438 [Gallowayella weberi]
MDSQRKQGTLEGSEEFQLVLEQKGLPRTVLELFPQFKRHSMDYIRARDPKVASIMGQEMERVITAPPRDRMKYDTIESYMELRAQDCGMYWFYELCAYGMDLEINETEKEQASRPTRAIIKAIIYVNDFYSWDKEKAEQKAVAANQDMFSAVTVLMKERQISETNALDMVRAKALEWEKEHWAAVADLEAAGPISANLYRYLEMTRFCHTGGMLWSAFTDRYSNMGQTQVGGDSRTPETLSMPKHENTSARQVLALVNDSSSNIET